MATDPFVVVLGPSRLPDQLDRPRLVAMDNSEPLRAVGGQQPELRGKWLWLPAQHSRHCSAKTGGICNGHMHGERCLPEQRLIVR